MQYASRLRRDLAAYDARIAQCVKDRLSILDDLRWLLLSNGEDPNGAELLADIVGNYHGLFEEKPAIGHRLAACMDEISKL